MNSLEHSWPEEFVCVWRRAHEVERDRINHMLRTPIRLFHWQGTRCPQLMGNISFPRWLAGWSYRESTVARGLLVRQYLNPSRWLLMMFGSSSPQQRRPCRMMAGIKDHWRTAHKQNHSPKPQIKFGSRRINVIRWMAKWAFIPHLLVYVLEGTY